MSTFMEFVDELNPAASVHFMPPPRNLLGAFDVALQAVKYESVSQESERFHLREVELSKVIEK